MKKLLLLLLLVFIGCTETYLDIRNTTVVVRSITNEDENDCSYLCRKVKEEGLANIYYLRDTCNKYRIGDTLILNVKNK